MNWIRTKESQSFLLFKMRFCFIFVIAVLVAVSFFVSATLVSGRTDRIELSSEEAAWLTTHPVIFYAPDPDYAPFEFKDNTNHYAGIAPDFLKLVGIKLGVQFKEVPSPSWNASLDNVKRHKADLVTVATKTPERSEYMLFTSPYIEFRNVILMREDVSGNFKMADLEGKTIAAIKGWAITTYIQKNFPDIKLLWVANVRAALKSVSSGTVDAVLLNRATAGYWRSKTDISNLRIAGETDYSYKLSFASRKDWPQLNRLLEKALSDISESERREIVDKWIFPFRQGWRPGQHFRIALAGAIVLLLFIGIFSWVVSLRRQVQARTIDLQTKLTERKQAEEALRDSEERFRLLYEKAPLAYQSLDENGNVLDVNQAWIELLGYTIEEVIGKSFVDFLHPDQGDSFKENFLRFKAIGEVLDVEFEMVKRDGSTILASFNGKIMEDDTGGFKHTHCILQDITKERRSEQALLESEDKYRQLFKTVSDAIMLFDAETKIFVDVNDSCLNMYGYSKNDFLKLRHSDITAEPEKSSESIKQVLSGEVIKIPLRYHKRKEGTKFPVEISSGKFKLGNRQLVCGIVRDISERKQAEKALREREASQESILRAAPVGIGMVRNRTFSWVSDRFIEMLGYTQDELIGKSAKIIYEDDEEFDRVGRVKYGQIGEKGTGKVDTRFRRKDGSIIDVHLKSTPVEPADFSKGVIFTAMDITDRKQAQKLLQESEEKYRSMMEAMKDLVYICSPDYRVEYMNPAMIKRTGRDATGEHCFKALHDLDEKCPWCLLHKTQTGDHFTTDIVSPKDNRSYLVSHLPIFHEDGSISKMIIFRDTTDFKKMETQLQQAQKMEAIGTLAGGIAHDFNNILSPMFGYLEMMLGDVPEDSPLHDSLERVFNGAKRARDLAKQILTFSSQKDHELKPLKVHLAVKEALKLIKSSLPSTIEISQNIKTDCGLVMADSTRIHQVVMNLCTNAYHAMEKTGGKLTVNLKEVELTVEDLKDLAMIPGPHVCLTVADTGPGMDQGIIARIFDPYFTTKENGKGTGLGLAVVHGIVKSHGGHISVYSEPGKGTEFKVYLPVIKPQETAQSIEDDLPIQKGNERILLVDDQDIIVDMERQMLERLGYHVTARISSTDALETFRAQPDKFDLVITDMTMPNMTGDKLAVELIKIRSDIPVILCTGFSEMMTEEKAKTLGIKGFLMKPVVMKELSNAIRKVLDDK